MNSIKVIASVLVFTSLLCGSNCLAMYDSGDEAPVGVLSRLKFESEKLEKTAKRFMAFMRKMGCADLDKQEVMDELVISRDELFASDFVKTVNNKKLYSTSDMIIPQLVQARKDVGAWTMTVKSIKPNPDYDSVGIVFTWKSVKEPEHIVWADITLRGIDGKIKRLFEIYNKCDVTIGTEGLEGKKTE